MKTLEKEKKFINNYIEKINLGKQIKSSEALKLYQKANIHDLAKLANIKRKSLHGNKASYLVNRYINYSNVCVLSCQFCAFAAKKGDKHAFLYSPDEIAAKVEKSLDIGITEIHMVGGLHPKLPKSYYLETLKLIKKVSKNIHIKAFTAVEIKHLAKFVFKLPIQKTLEVLRENGLDSLTGGGAEIFNPEIRKQICRGKETAEEWCDIHRTWHNLGGKSTCTMLYGHLESLKDRINHMEMLRDLQAETGGFTGFIPLTFVPETTCLAHVKPATAIDQIKTIAISRIYLDNIQNITAYWIALGLDLASVCLSYGANDLHGTIEEEKIFHMAGSNTAVKQSKNKLQTAIKNAGFEPRQRDSHYKLI